MKLAAPAASWGRLLVIRLADGVDVRRMRQNRADEKATFETGCESASRP